MAVNNRYIQSTINQGDFDRISSYILENFGINLTANKKELLEFRLQKRLQKLGLESYSDYTRYLFSEEGQENEPHELINEVSTNKTDFFRENQHFTLLKEKILPDLVDGYNQKVLPIWSAGCSSGEEVYSLALTLENFKMSYPFFDYEILGTDISEAMISFARKAIYPLGTVSPIDRKDLRRYFLKSRNPDANLVRVKKQIRDKTQFGYLNLMDEDYKTPHIYPIIFCRNTLIYFNKETKASILGKLYSRLTKGGLLIISHTESLIKLDDRFKLIYPSVYQKRSMS